MRVGRDGRLKKLEQSPDRRQAADYEPLTKEFSRMGVLVAYLVLTMRIILHRQYRLQKHHPPLFLCVMVTMA